MRIERFKEYLRDKLANSGHPDIVRVETYDVPGGGVQDIKVTCADGVTLFLRVVRTSPPGGDNHSQPETIVTKRAATA